MPYTKTSDIMSLEKVTPNLIRTNVRIHKPKMMLQTQSLIPTLWLKPRNGMINSHLVRCLSDVLQPGNYLKKTIKRMKRIQSKNTVSMQSINKSLPEFL